MQQLSGIRGPDSQLQQLSTGFMLQVPVRDRPVTKVKRVIWDCSMAMLDSDIDVVCMGIPLQNVADSMLRSIGHAECGIN